MLLSFIIFFFFLLVNITVAAILIRINCTLSWGLSMNININCYLINHPVADSSPIWWSLSRPCHVSDSCRGCEIFTSNFKNSAFNIKPCAIQCIISYWYSLGTLLLDLPANMISWSVCKRVNQTCHSADITDKSRSLMGSGSDVQCCHVVSALQCHSADRPISCVRWRERGGHWHRSPLTEGNVRKSRGCWHR